MKEYYMCSTSTPESSSYEGDYLFLYEAMREQPIYSLDNIPFKTPTEKEFFETTLRERGSTVAKRGDVFCVGRVKGELMCILDEETMV